MLDMYADSIKDMLVCASTVYTLSIEDCNA
jgi:hypothetical protein